MVSDASRMLSIIDRVDSGSVGVSSPQMDPVSGGEEDVVCARIYCSRLLEAPCATRRMCKPTLVRVGLF